MRHYIVFIFFGFGIQGFAQTWQEYYKEINVYLDKDWNKAIPLLEKALPLAQTAYGAEPTKDTTYVTTLADLGVCKQKIGEYDQAKTYLVQAKEIAKILGYTHPVYNHACSCLGDLYLTTGQYSEAEVAFKEIEKNQSVLSKIHPEHAVVYLNLGTTYQYMGQYALAEQYLKEAKKMLEKYGSKDMYYITVCNNLGSLYKNMGLYTFSEQIYKENLTLATKVLGKKHPFYAQACNNLGGVYQDVGKYAAAESLYKESKEMRAQLFGKKHASYALACNNLGFLYRMSGQYTLAEPLYLEAKEILINTVGKKTTGYAFTCNNLGGLYLAMERYSEAEPLIIEAKNVRETYLGKKHPSYAQSCQLLALLYQNTKQYDKAEALLKEASHLKVEEIQKNFMVLTETQKENYLKLNESVFQSVYQFMTTHNHLVEESYNLLIATKGMILNSIKTLKERTLSSSDTNLKNDYNYWQNLNKKIAKANETPLEERKRKGLDLDSLQTLSDIVERKISLGSNDFKIAKEEANITYQDIQKQLKAKELAVEIVRIRNTKTKDTCIYAALLMTPQQTPTLLILSTQGEKMENEYLTNYKRSIKNKLIDTLSYKIFWETLAQYVQKNDIKKVFFSPDGVYNTLNLNTLYNPKTKKYVLDEVELVQLTNTKEILSKKEKPTIQNAVLLGRPDYKNKVKAQNTERSELLSDLQGTEIEVNNIAKVLLGKNITTLTLMQEFATKDTILHQISPSILHIATHGFFKPNTTLSTQRMLQSGLILAGSEVLSAFEAMQMDLRGTELVCLSACETGLGEVKAGEGVYGLQRAFKAAGAKSVIMSLWKVNDEATQELMSAFYRFWLQKNKSKRTAFYLAQQQLRKKYKDVYYWGAFVLIGE